ELHDLARRALARLHMEGRSRRHGCPDAATLPTRIGIVDATVHPLGVEPQWVRHTHRHELSVLEREQRFRRVPGIDWHVAPEAERVELIDPREVTRLGAAGLG